MEKKQFIYEGKAKRVYSTTDTDLVIVEYKDDATAFNGLKKGTITGKGLLNNSISSFFFTLLQANGIPSHFVRQLSDTEMLVKKLDIIKVEVVARNVAAGSFSKRLGLAEGSALSQPVLEFYYKDDALADPMINEYHIFALKLAESAHLEQIAESALKINQVLLKYLREKDIILVDFKLEFGLFKGEVLLGDEISPDTCRFWDAATGEKLDKDRFRRDLGGVREAYEEILKRLTGGAK